MDHFAEGMKVLRVRQSEEASTTATKSEHKLLYFVLPLAALNVSYTQVKAEMDHFAEGMKVLGVLDKVKRHPLLFAQLYTDCHYHATPLTAGCGINEYIVGWIIKFTL